MAVVTKDGAPVLLEAIDPERVLSYSGQLELIYCSAFGGAPWFESAREAHRFVLRLLDHTESPSFRLVVARSNHQLVGFSYGRIAVIQGEPIGEPYVQMLEWLDPEVAASVLYDGFEVAELCVNPSWQGKGIGGGLLKQLLMTAPTKRAWLLTHDQAERAQALYRSRGWRAVADIGLPSSRRVLMAVTDIS